MFLIFFFFTVSYGTFVVRKTCLLIQIRISVFFFFFFRTYYIIMLSWYNRNSTFVCFTCKKLLEQFIWWKVVEILVPHTTTEMRKLKSSFVESIFPSIQKPSRYLPLCCFWNKIIKRTKTKNSKKTVHHERVFPKGERVHGSDQDFPELAHSLRVLCSRRLERDVGEGKCARGPSALAGALTAWSRGNQTKPRPSG